MHYGMKKKLTVADMYLHYEQLDGGRPSLLKIESEHKVSRKFVLKIESELYTNVGGLVGQNHRGRDSYRQGRNHQREGICLRAC
jgi:hypothetical protein